MARKQTLFTQTKAKLIKKEKNFFRMTIDLTLLFTIARVSEMIVVIIIRCESVLGIEFRSEFQMAFNLARQITLLFMYASHAFGFYVYLTRDKNLKVLVRRLLN